MEFNNPINVYPVVEQVSHKTSFENKNQVDAETTRNILQKMPDFYLKNTLTFFNIEGILVASNIFSDYFECKIEACGGVCCKIGDSGALLETDELSILNAAFPSASRYMDSKCVEIAGQAGLYQQNLEGDWTTTMADKHGCIFAVKANGSYLCSLHQAFEDGVIDFKKPISCDLSPIRKIRYKGAEVIFYRPWNICNTGCMNGREKNVKVFQFAETSLVRNYGTQWYAQLLNLQMEI
jgi:hypothetical protein